MKRKTIFNILLILLVLSFFVTPIGYESKIILQRIFASSVDIYDSNKSPQIDYDWKLKDRNNIPFNFKESKGKPIMVFFWSSWDLKSVANLSDIQNLYDSYKDRIDFYLITNELADSVEEMMKKRGYNFKVTYLIIGEKMPFDASKVPSGYIIDKKGFIRAYQDGVANWNHHTVKELLDEISK